MLRNFLFKKIKKYFFCILLFTTLQSIANAQGVMVTYSHNLSTNPLKFAMGLINLEYEYVLTEDVTVRIAAEFMIGDKLFFRNVAHPKTFIDLGLRYYLQDIDEGNLKGLFIGSSLGHIYMHQSGSESSFTVGIENGYRIHIPDHFYLTPKLSLFYPIKSKEILPGVELRIGTSF